MSRRLSLCLIVRDEERLLPGCLASVAGLADEVVVVDTGSADRTAELAREAGAKVILRPWDDDFSAARNAALAAATGDWVLQLDADERLAPGAAPRLRAAVEADRSAALLLPLHDASRLDAPPEEVLSGRARLGEPALLLRAFRRLPGIAYRGPIHESVGDWLGARGHRAAVVDAPIVHYGAVPGLRAERAKRDRNLDLLRRWCDAADGEVTPFGYLAVELLQTGDPDAAWAVAERGWALLDAQPPGRVVHRLAVARAAAALQRGAPGAALDTLDRLAARDGDSSDGLLLRADAHLALARAAPPGSGERRDRARAAAEACSGALAQEGRPDPSRFLPGSASHAAAARLGAALLLLGRPADARAAFEAALARAPGLPEPLLGRAEALLDEGRPAEALAALETLLDARPDGWLLAAAAAAALGAASDARALFAEAGRRWGAGIAAERRERGEALAAALGHPLPGSPPRGGGGDGPVAAPGAAPSRFAVTVVSPPGYPHSQAFREIAETLHYGLLALGHDCVLTDRADLPGRRHVLLGSNLLPSHPIPLAPDTVLYNLEQVDRASTWLSPALLDLFRRHTVWDYSEKNADELARMGLPRPRVVPVGFAPALVRIPAREEDIDVLFYGSVNERRKRVLDALAAAGARVQALFGVYGPERDAFIARSKLVVNPHYFEAKVFEVVRVSYLLANGRCVVSERGADPVEERAFEDAVAFAPYEALVATCLRLLGDPAERAHRAEAGRRLMEARPESEYLRAALG
ncbi:glycosyltransferase [Anaeromyxobacter paludicola]|uniref:Glycosyltransferase 2-like domain-containing protein n=1 Tax=Anaeromyxobacter paludicola TaxID=2918171 RepID=A0ABM7X5H9_9BACT|nr:glycosyltransferase [Anaeromyxobacter paludicola]BDG07075.1 hypothetical protein AMPC_01880 [Anaeromyxobacter paludicola]